MNLKRWSERVAAASSALFIAAIARAQQATDPSTNAGSNTTTTTTTVWYGHWFIWVGIALFVIVVIALTRSGGARRS